MLMMDKYRQQYKIAKMEELAEITVVGQPCEHSVEADESTSVSNNKLKGNFCFYEYHENELGL